MDEFIRALENYLEAKAGRNKAFDSCDDTWGYCGQHIEAELVKAKERLETAFNAAVIKAVKEQRKWNIQKVK